MAKLPRNSAPGYGSASVFASVFTGRSPIFARIWRVSRGAGDEPGCGAERRKKARSWTVTTPCRGSGDGRGSRPPLAWAPSPVRILLRSRLLRHMPRSAER